MPTTPALARPCPPPVPPPRGRPTPARAATRARGCRAWTGVSGSRRWRWSGASASRASRAARRGTRRSTSRFGRLLFGTAVLAAAMAVCGARRRRAAPARASGGGGVLPQRPAVLAVRVRRADDPSTLAGICNATSPLWGMILSLVALSRTAPLGGVWRGSGRLPGRADACSGPGRGSRGSTRRRPRRWVRPRATRSAGSTCAPDPPGGRGESHLSLTGARLMLATAQVAVATAPSSGVPTAFPGGSAAGGGRAGRAGHGGRDAGPVRDRRRSRPRQVRWSRTSSVIATAAGVTPLDEPLAWNTLSEPSSCWPARPHRAAAPPAA